MASILHYFELLRNLVLKDFRIRYQGSMGGPIWSLLKPLSLIAVLAFAFGRAVNIQIPRYPVFLFSGIIHWAFFSNALHMATSSLTHNADLIRRASFPRLVLPTAAVIVSFCEFLLAVGAFAIAYAWLDGTLWIGILWYPIILALQVLLLLGLAYAVSSLTVFLRDFRDIVDLLIGLLFWVTPIVYSLDTVPPEYRRLFVVNPMVAFTDAYHRIFWAHIHPSPSDWTWMLLWPSVALVLGLLIFRSLNPRVPEAL